MSLRLRKPTHPLLTQMHSVWAMPTRPWSLSVCVCTGVAPSQMLDRSCSMSTVQLIFLPPNSWPACVRISPRPIHRKRLSAGGSGSKCRRSDLENLGKAARSSRFQEGQTRAKARLFKGQRRAKTKFKRRANGRRVTGL